MVRETRFVEVIEKQITEVTGTGYRVLVRVRNIDGRTATVGIWISRGMWKDADIDLDAIILDQATTAMIEFEKDIRIAEGGAYG